ncbi:hypothetical protein EXH46_23350 [Pelomonas puraquae]|nr:hypothetical protein [Roseateles puraquae]
MISCVSTCTSWRHAVSASVASSDSIGATAASRQASPCTVRADTASTARSSPCSVGRLTTCRPGAAWFSKACKASGSAALAQVGGNISQAAKLLGVSRAALYRKLDKHGL